LAIKGDYMKKAFTLAEVLITLGIIGIVAALTMPALMANYRKKVLETRIKKFYSVINQSVRMKQAQDGEFDTSMLTAAADPDVMLEFFNKNYAPYLKTTSVEKMTKGLAVGFPDGSGMYLFKTEAYGEWYQTAGCTYILFCVSYKNCKKLNEANFSPHTLSDGKEVFTFYTDGRTPTSFWNDTRESLKQKCKVEDVYYCSTLLMYDGWEVKDDYPIKL
jgi:prepilin-type N-terminal cleavage/methylation domain-containing protein